MRKFTIKVNGKPYQVEVEETDGAPSNVVPVATMPSPQPERTVAAPASSGLSGAPVPAPLPGLVLELSVANGAVVKKGDKILVLEAMKMENDIVANADGTITLAVKKGDSIQTGEAVAYIK